MSPGHRSLLLSVLTMVALPSIANAQDAAQCKDGYDRSQISRDSGKLVEARKLLQQCSSATCSQFMQRECTGWLADVEARVPSVILSAKSGDGVDVVDVTVTVDGKEVTRKLDGRALDMDPGEHTFVLAIANGKHAEQHVLVREREKGKSVAVTIGEPTSPVDKGIAPAQSTSPLKIGGFIVGGVGIAGLAVGTIFGLVASSKLSAPSCDESTKKCDPGVVSSAKSAATVSTIGFIGGGVLVAGGVAMVLLAPKSTKETSHARLTIAPLAANNGGGASLQGTW